MIKDFKKYVILLVILLLVIPANTSSTYAAPIDTIYSILNRGSEKSSGKDLILKALNKTEEQEVKIIETKEELKEVKEVKKAKNKNSYILGLDISKWNGYIDWKAVKDADIEFVIIRAGYGTNYVDPYFKQNIEAAIDNDLLIGIYWFSYAHTYQQAKLEADKCYKTIKPYKDKIDLPVFWDFEYDSVNYANRNGHGINKKLASGMADTFCTNIKNKGMQTGIYTNIDYSNRYFTKEVLNKYHTWIAQWSSQCTYKDNYIIWQCSDKFYIKNKRFDLNRFYYNRYTHSSSTKKEMIVSATAYSGDTITSLGTIPKWGTIAVDPSVIPYGSVVYIPTFDKYFVALDCGGGIKGKRIDIFMNSEKEARKWGVRKIKIQILQGNGFINIKEVNNK